jgi:N-acetylglucosaminyldiphosphoundecaprenol N-acetyl-beta-D-mannosaminyltransferase
MHGLERTLFGLPLDAVTIDRVLEICRDSLASRQRTLIGVVNAAKIVNQRRDAELRQSLLECDLLLADGQSVVWASRLLRRPLPERVAGIDVFERLLGLAAAEERSVYLLGAKIEVLKTLQDRILKSYPGLRIAGARDGYFAEDESADVAAGIRASKADMLFLGMTSPKKENFLGAYGAGLNVPVQHGVGGSFDVLAGLTKRAPEIWQRIGCEWLYRLLQEPRRLWRRYLRTNTAFLLLTAREMIRPTPAARSTAPAQTTPAVRTIPTGQVSATPTADSTEAISA